MAAASSGLPTDSDAAFVVAQVQDAQGNLVPTAADNVTFTVTGPATYMGGTQQLVADPAPFSTYYQGCLLAGKQQRRQRPAVCLLPLPRRPRTELRRRPAEDRPAQHLYRPAPSPLPRPLPASISGSVQLASVDTRSGSRCSRRRPPSSCRPPDTAVTAGYPATFNVAASGSGTLSYQWYQGTAVHRRRHRHHLQHAATTTVGKTTASSSASP